MSDIKQSLFQLRLIRTILILKSICTKKHGYQALDQEEQDPRITHETGSETISVSIRASHDKES